MTQAAAHLSQVPYDLLIRLLWLVLGAQPLRFLFHLLPTQLTEVRNRPLRSVVAIPIIIANVLELLLDPSPDHSIPISSLIHVLRIYSQVRNITLRYSTLSRTLFILVMNVLFGIKIDVLPWRCPAAAFAVTCFLSGNFHHVLVELRIGVIDIVVGVTLPLPWSGVGGELSSASRSSSELVMMMMMLMPNLPNTSVTLPRVVGIPTKLVYAFVD
jgi:hypothetical protein